MERGGSAQALAAGILRCVRFYFAPSLRNIVAAGYVTATPTKKTARAACEFMLIIIFRTIR